MFLEINFLPHPKKNKEHKVNKILVELIADPRDVLQGLNYSLDNQKYVDHLINVAKSGFQHIMVGSLVNPDLVPAMANSEARACEFLEQYKDENITRQILVFRPHGRYMNKAIELIEKKAVNSIAYTHSLSGAFLYNNNGIGRRQYPNYSDEHRQEIIEISREMVRKFVARGKELGISLDIHISKVTEDLSNMERQPELLQEIKEEYLILAEITKDIKGRILLSDTSGEATPQNINALMHTIVDARIEHNISKSLGLHLHTNPEETQLLTELIFASLEPLNKLEKERCVSFDIGFGGIGGCPFDSANPKANLQVNNILQIAKTLHYAGIEIQPKLKKSDIEMLDSEVKTFVNQSTDSKQKTIFEKFKELFVS